ncbi:LysR substrate-binding domain-containing protein [Actinomadura sp. LOL_016]|uniref:LysR substrate-binding domain-containing protein n=1 Tax=unclassified Actinomadura TaxID=2626254 RepID=UPI003A810F3B
MPVRGPDLTVRPTPHSSELLLMVSADHPYAEQDTICLEDLGDCTVVEGQSIPSYMEEVFNPRHTPSGHPIRRGPKVTTWLETLSVVSSGQATTAVTAEVADFCAWPSLAFVPIRDAPFCQWSFVWRTSNETPLIRALARAAADVHRPAG